MISVLKKLLPSLLLISILGFFVYSFNLNNPLFWDDDDWIIGNTYVHDFSHIKEIFSENMLAGFGLNSNYYRPLLSLSFALNYSLGGIEPFGYHLVSNLFHIGNALLIFLILFRLFNNKSIATIASIGWLLHPIHVESVAYISGRGDPMSLFFVLLVLCLFSWLKELKWKHYLLAIFLFICGLLSRETAIILPALIILIKLFISEKKILWDRFKEGFKISIPFWLIGAGYFILRLTVLNFDNTLNFYEEDSLYSENIHFRIFTFLAVFTKYLAGIFWPVGLHMEPNIPIHTSLLSGPVLLGLGILVSIVLIGYYLFKNRKEFGYVWIGGWLWFFIAISPASGIIPINAIMYYHWLYGPMIGLMVILGYVIFNILKSISNKSLANLFIFILIIYLGFLSIINIRHNILWGNEIAFYENLLKYNPESLRVINNLANAYSEKGNLNKAKELYERGISLSENIFPQPFYNLGNIHRDQGNLDEAIKMYLKALEIDSTFHFAYTNLAQVYIRQGNLNKALEYMSQVSALRPQDGLLLANLGLIRLELGERAQGLVDLNNALELLNPESREYSEIRRIIEGIK